MLLNCQKPLFIHTNREPLARHSQNQKTLKWLREGERRVYGDTDSKAAKAKARKAERAKAIAREQFGWLDLPPIDIAGTTTEISQLSFTPEDREKKD